MYVFYDMEAFGSNLSSGSIMMGDNMTRPVLYLESNIQIVGGNGSKANPYKLS
jgi:hypothetical protein